MQKSKYLILVSLAFVCALGFFSCSEDEEKQWTAIAGEWKIYDIAPDQAPAWSYAPDGRKLSEVVFYFGNEGEGNFSYKDSVYNEELKKMEETRTYQGFDYSCNDGVLNLTWSEAPSSAEYVGPRDQSATFSCNVAFYLRDVAGPEDKKKDERYVMEWTKDSKEAMLLIRNYNI